MRIFYKIWVEILNEWGFGVLGMTIACLDKKFDLLYELILLTFKFKSLNK